MLYEAVVIAVLVSISSAKSAYIKPAKYNKTEELNNNVTTNITDIIMSEEVITQYLDEKSAEIYNVTSETIDQTGALENTDVRLVTTTGSFTQSGGHNDSLLKVNPLKLPEKLLNNSQSHGNTNTSNNNDTFTTETLTTHDKNKHRTETLFSEQLLNESKHSAPYHIHNDDDHVQMLILERKKIQLQHHLQLVPMEDEPLGAMMFKNQRYVISILVPIGVGMIGAAMIVCTVFTLRKVARRRAVTAPLDDNMEEERPNTPCISSIRTETTDKMFLLLGDDEI